MIQAILLQIMLFLGNIFQDLWQWLEKIRTVHVEVSFMQWLTIIIVFCIIVFIFLIVFMLINRGRMARRLKRESWLRQNYQQLLLDYLSADDKDKIDEILSNISDIARNRFTRARLIEEIIDLSENLIGHRQALIRFIYFHLGLDKDTLAKVRQRKWHIKVKGYKEAVLMNLKDAFVYKSMRHSLKSRNKYLRMEAQLALMRIDAHDPFWFLDQLKHPFTLWEQMNAHEMITFYELPVPQFSRWTNSSNDSVVLFALRMIQVFKQKDAVQAVLECLDHPNEKIRHQAIIVCGEIQLNDTLPKLKHMYKNEGYNNCLAIVETMGKMPDESNINFLKLVLDKEDDIQLQINSAIAISKTGEAGVSALVKLMKSKDQYKNYQIIIRHVLDKRIS